MQNPSRPQEISDELRLRLSDCVLVDAMGQPRLVYHGTTARFESFDVNRVGDLGVHFGGLHHARHFAGTAGRIIEAYLALRNPVELRDSFDAKITSAQDTIWQLEQKGVLTPAVASHLRATALANFPDAVAGVRRTWTAIREAMLAAGVDGVIYNNENAKEGEGICYVALRADQILVRAPRPRQRERSPSFSL